MSVNRLENMEKRDIYILVIDSICKLCGFRNKGSYRVDEDGGIICCGKCANIIYTPEEITEEELGMVEKIVRDEIKNRNNDSGEVRA